MTVGSSARARTMGLWRWVLPCAAMAAVACGTSTASQFSGGSSSGTVSNGGGEDASTAGGDDATSFLQTDGGILIGPGMDGGSAAPDAGGTSSPTPMSIDRCTTGAPSGLSATQVNALLAGGSPGALRYLYPYAETVFPRGLISPTLMWDLGSAQAGGAADFVYVHIKSKLREYKGCLAPTAPGQLLLPQDAWNAASDHAFRASGPFPVSLTLIASGNGTGPVPKSLLLPPPTLHASL